MILDTILRRLDVQKTILNEGELNQICCEMFT